MSAKHGWSQPEENSRGRIFIQSPHRPQYVDQPREAPESRFQPLHDWSASRYSLRVHKSARFENGVNPYFRTAPKVNFGLL